MPGAVRPLTSPEAAYFHALQRAFERTAGTSTVVERDLLVDGLRLRLAFAGESLATLMLPPLDHLAETSRGRPDTRICVWDDASTGSRLPVFPWRPTDIGRQGLVKGYCTERIRTVYHGNVTEPPLFGFNAVSMFDRYQRTALFWVASPDRLPWSECLEPLRPSLHWVLGEHDRHLVHAAGVATEHGCVLLVGKGWSGKTTTAVACTQAGFGFLGDNYVVLSMRGGEPVAHSLFSNAKLRLDGRPILFDLEDGGTGVRRLGDRLVVDFHSRLGERVITAAEVRAVLIVEQTGGDGTELLPGSPGQGLLALAPSSIYQLPSNGGAGLRPMAELLRLVPTYVLAVGRRPTSAPPAIAELLRTL